MACDSLPYDILRPLLELAAYHDQSTAFSLSLVSRDVNLWVTEILYRSIHLHIVENRDPCPVRRLLETLTKMNPQLLLQVRCLQITGRTHGNAYIDSLLSIFNEPSTLLSLSLIPYSPHINGFTGSLPTSLTSLTWEATGLTELIRNFSDLQLLTHLHIISVDNDNDSLASALTFQYNFRQPTTLPRLRRVAISFHPLGREHNDPDTLLEWTQFGNLLVPWISTRPAIEMCVLSFHTKTGFDGLPGIPPLGLQLLGFAERIVVVGDKGLESADPDVLILPNGFEPSLWRDMSCWEASYEFMISRNERRGRIPADQRLF
ncbi:hypothetical protein DL96DRAFT_1627192 [Flagelloscypha sp. PMI_526]|nr:hypothetical protein DL96DRAFT_1627192 [Flagelloscypha sp. PMI_526]